MSSGLSAQAPADRRRGHYGHCASTPPITVNTMKTGVIKKKRGAAVRRRACPVRACGRRRCVSVDRQRSPVGARRYRPQPHHSGGLLHNHPVRWIRQVGDTADLHVRGRRHSTRPRKQAAETAQSHAKPTAAGHTWPSRSALFYFLNVLQNNTLFRKW